MPRLLVVLPVLLAVLAGSLRAEEEDPVLAALESPAATGVLVVGVTPGSRADQAGIRRGDVIVTYDGKPVPDVPALTRAKEVAISKPEVVVELVRPDGKKASLKLEPGQIGVRLVPVEKGKAADPLPPATGVKFDFSSLAKDPWDSWYWFGLEEGKKAGFEHVLLSLEEGRLVLRQEVAFDGGERWGVNHFDVALAVTAEAMPRLVKTSFEDPRNGWISLGRVTEFEDGTRDWTTTVRAKGEEPKVTARPVPRDCVPGYLVAHLAAFMPREKNACLHFRPLEEGVGQIGLPAALLAIGEEEIDHRGEKVKAFRYEQRRIGGDVASTYWVGPRGRVLLVDYGGARAVLATKEEALSDLHPAIEPRTAD